MLWSLFCFFLCGETTENNSSESALELDELEKAIKKRAEKDEKKEEEENVIIKVGGSNFTPPIQSRHNHQEPTIIATANSPEPKPIARHEEINTN